MVRIDGAAFGGFLATGFRAGHVAVGGADHADAIMGTRVPTGSVRGLGADRLRKISLQDLQGG